MSTYAAAGSGTSFLLVNGNYEGVQAHLIKRHGEKLENVRLTLHEAMRSQLSSDDDGSTRVSVAWNGSHYVVVWPHLEGANYRTHWNALMLDDDGRVIANDIPIASSVLKQIVSLGKGDSVILSQGRAQAISDSGVVSPEIGLFDRPYYSSIAASKDRYLVTFDTSAFGLSSMLMLDPAGQLAGFSVPFPCCVNTDPLYTQAVAAWDGQGFVMGWPSNGLVGLRLDPTGGMRDSSVFRMLRSDDARRRSGRSPRETADRWLHRKDT